MKKVIMSFAAAALVCGALALTSCSKSNQSIIDDYRSLCEEMVEAAKSGDYEKVLTLKEKGDELTKEFNDRDFTDAEKAEILQISFETTAEMSKLKH